MRTACAFFVALLFVLVPQSLVAQTIIRVDADASAPGDGTSWGSAYPALQDAFDEANANAGTDYEIWIAEGTYYPDVDNVDNDGDGSTEHTADADASFTLNRDGVEVYGGFSGGETSRSARDPSANVVTLSGDIAGDDDPFAPNTDTDGDSSTPTQTDHINKPNATHVVDLNGRSGENITGNTVVGGLTITGGHTDGGTFPANVGGGLLCDGGQSGNECSATLSNLTFEGNFAYAGGALINVAEKGGLSNPTLTDVTFRANASSQFGGAIYNDAGDGSQGGTASPSVSGGSFSNNVAASGGAIFNEATGGTANMSISNTTFENNSASTAGGALYIYCDQGATSNPQITGTDFLSNTANFGGAMYAYVNATNGSGTASTADFSLTNSTVFSNNDANTAGGAVYVEVKDGAMSTPAVDGTNFSSNTAGSGGALYLHSKSTDGSGTPSLIDASIGSNTTFSQNTASSRGGAVMIEGQGGGEARPDISGVTFSSNSAEHGGAVEVLSDGTDGSGTPSQAQPSFTDVMFLDNEASGATDGSGNPISDGGAVVHRTTGGGTGGASFVNTVFAGNTASATGGALQNLSSGSGTASPELTNVTTAGNTAGNDGDALSNENQSGSGSAAPVLTNVILWNAASSSDVLVQSGTPSISYSIVNGGCPSGATCSGNLLNEDPQFAGANGGAGSDGTFGTSDDDLRLQGPGSLNGASPAIDAGDNAAISVSNGLGGNSRKIDVASVANTGTGSPPVDFGAYESVGDRLPVELARFDARLNDDAVTLSWETVSETDNAGFRVQRRAGDDRWTDVGRVAGAGTTTKGQSYSFTDETLPYEADRLTYRLKQIDTNGSVQFSKEAVVTRGVHDVQLLGTYPNPASHQAHIRYALPETQDVTVRLYDVMGRQVRTVINASQEGRHEATLEVSDLPSGVYFLRLASDGDVRSQRLTVVR